MTATTPDVAAQIQAPRDVRLTTVSKRRRRKNAFATFAMALSLFVAAVPLVYVSISVIQHGASVISKDFLSSDIPRTAAAGELQGDCAAQAKYGGDIAGCEEASDVEAQPGMGPAVIGTFIVTGLATLFAVPLGIMASVYLNEYGKAGPLARFIRFMTDVMTGVPSIVMGIFIYAFFVVNLGQGRSALAAALALACLMLPIVVRSSEEMLKLVPDSLREGSSALGARTWKTTTRVVLPSALPGLVSGSMLAIARAAGETAPVLFTVGAIFDTKDAWTVSGQSTTLSYQIFNQITNGGRLSPQMAWGAALTLIVIVLVLTIVARAVSRRFTMR